MSNTATTIPPYQGAGDAPTTPAATPSGPAPAVPNQPVPTGPTANALDPSIAAKTLPGGGQVGAQPAQPAKPYTDKQLVQELATALGVKPKKGQSLEVGVAQALSSKYKVKFTGSATTTEGTGTGQGTVGGIRHNIASWFDQAVSAAPGLNITSPNSITPSPMAEANAPAVERDIKQLTDQANKIKNPRLRQQALAKIDRETQGIEGIPADLGKAPGTPEPVPNTKALNDMLGQVAAKLGVQQAGPNALADIAKGQNLPTASTATAATSGTAQTAGDAYQIFVKNLSDPKTGAQFAAANVPALEAAGLLDRNASGAKQANGTTFTNQQISTAYQAVLQQQVSQNQTEQQALTALASTTAIPGGGPTSEMQSYVQGVATEFGVGLTPQQITQIANTYGANATTAGDPSSVEDEIKNAVVSLYDPSNPNNPAGVASTMFEDIKNSALSYQIPITDQQIGNMVKTSLQGATVESMYVAADAAEAAATKQFQEQAQGLYPALSEQIGAGQTVQNLTAPYFNVAEAITGVPASTMMADQQGGGVSKWAAFLQGGNNPAGATKTNVAPGMSNTTGGPQMMTLDQWKTYLMQNPSYGFQNTQGGKDMAEQLTSAILNEFGKVNTTSGAPINLYQGQSDLTANTSSA